MKTLRLKDADYEFLRVALEKLDIIMGHMDALSDWYIPPDQHYSWALDRVRAILDGVYKPGMNPGEVKQALEGNDKTE